MEIFNLIYKCIFLNEDIKFEEKQVVIKNKYLATARRFLYYVKRFLQICFLCILAAGFLGFLIIITVQYTPKLFGIYLIMLILFVAIIDEDEKRGKKNG